MTADYNYNPQIHNPELLEIKDLLDKFVYSCSHDLKGPLVSIKGLLRLAELSTQKEATDECLTLINESVTRMDKFIKSLEFYMGNARGPVLRNEIDLEKVINDIMKSRQNIISQNKIKVNLKIENQPKFKSDSMRVTLILSNIIDNAIYFQDMNKHEKFVDIDVQITEKSAKIEICDNGEGISKENMDKIYGMFFRASEASKGSGMGLFLADEAIKKLNGTITVLSSKGVGSNFIVEIPNTSY